MESHGALRHRFSAPKTCLAISQKRSHRCETAPCVSPQSISDSDPNEGRYNVRRNWVTREDIIRQSRCSGCVIASPQQSRYSGCVIASPQQSRCSGCVIAPHQQSRCSGCVIAPHQQSRCSGCVIASPQQSRCSGCVIASPQQSRCSGCVIASPQQSRCSGCVIAPPKQSRCSGCVIAPPQQSRCSGFGNASPQENRCSECIIASPHQSRYQQDTSHGNKDAEAMKNDNSENGIFMSVDVKNTHDKEPLNKVCLSMVSLSSGNNSFSSPTPSFNHHIILSSIRSKDLSEIPCTCLHKRDVRVRSKMGFVFRAPTTQNTRGLSEGSWSCLSPRACGRSRFVRHNKYRGFDEGEIERSGRGLQTRGWGLDKSWMLNTQPEHVYVPHKRNRSVRRKSFKRTVDRESLKSSSISCSSLSFRGEELPVTCPATEKGTKLVRPVLASHEDIEWFVLQQKTQNGSTTSAIGQPLCMPVATVQPITFRKSIQTPDPIEDSDELFQNRFEKEDTKARSILPGLSTAVNNSNLFGSSANALLYSSPPEKETENWTCHSDHAKNGNEAARQQRITFRQCSVASGTNRNIQTFTLRGVKSEETKKHPNMNDRPHAHTATNRLQMRNRPLREAGNTGSSLVSLDACSSELKSLITSTIADMQKYASQAGATTGHFGQASHLVTRQHGHLASQETAARQHGHLTSQETAARQHGLLASQETAARQHGHLTSQETATRQHGHLTTQETVTRQHGHLTTQETVTRQHGHLTTQETATRQHGHLTTQETVTRQHGHLTSQETATRQHGHLTSQETATRQHGHLTSQETATRQHGHLTTQETATRQHGHLTTQETVTRQHGHLTTQETATRQHGHLTSQETATRQHGHLTSQETATRQHGHLTSQETATRQHGHLTSQETVTRQHGHLTSQETATRQHGHLTSQETATRQHGHLTSQETATRQHGHLTTQETATRQHGHLTTQETATRFRHLTTVPSEPCTSTSPQQLPAGKNKHRVNQEQRSTHRRYGHNPRYPSTSNSVTRIDDQDNLGTDSNFSGSKTDISTSSLDTKSRSDNELKTAITEVVPQSEASPCTVTATRSSWSSSELPRRREEESGSVGIKSLDNDVICNGSVLGLANFEHKLDNGRSTEIWGPINRPESNLRFGKPVPTDPPRDNSTFLSPSFLYPRTGFAFLDAVKIPEKGTPKSFLDKAFSRKENQFTRARFPGSIHGEFPKTNTNREVGDNYVTNQQYIFNLRNTISRKETQQVNISQENEIPQATKSKLDANSIVKYLHRKHGKRLDVSDPRVDRIINMIASRGRKNEVRSKCPAVIQQVSRDAQGHGWVNRLLSCGVTGAGRHVMMNHGRSNDPGSGCYPWSDSHRRYASYRGGGNQTRSNSTRGSYNRSVSDNNSGSDNHCGSDNQSWSDNNSGSDNHEESDVNLERINDSLSDARRESDNRSGSGNQRGSDNSSKSDNRTGSDNHSGSDKPEDSDNSPFIYYEGQNEKQESDNSLARSDHSGSEKIREMDNQPQYSCHGDSDNKLPGNSQTTGEFVSRGPFQQANTHRQTMAPGELHNHLSFGEHDSRTKVQHKNTHLRARKLAFVSNVGGTRAEDENEVKQGLQKQLGINDNSATVTHPGTNNKLSDCNKTLNTFDIPTRAGFFTEAQCPNKAQPFSVKEAQATDASHRLNGVDLGTQKSNLNTDPRTSISLSIPGDEPGTRESLHTNRSSSSPSSTTPKTYSLPEHPALRDFNVSRKSKTDSDVNVIQTRNVDSLDDKKRLLEEIKKSPWDKRKRALLQQYLSIPKQQASPGSAGQAPHVDELKTPKVDDVSKNLEYCLTGGILSHTMMKGDEHADMAAHCIHHLDNRNDKNVEGAHFRASAYRGNHLEDSMSRNSSHTKTAFGNELIIMSLERNDIERCLATGGLNDSQSDTSLYVAEVIGSSSSDSQKLMDSEKGTETKLYKLSSSSESNISSRFVPAGRIFHTLEKAKSVSSEMSKRKGASQYWSNDKCPVIARDTRQRATPPVHRHETQDNQGKTAAARNFSKRYVSTPVVASPSGSITDSELIETIPAYSSPRQDKVYSSSLPRSSRRVSSDNRNTKRASGVTFRSPSLNDIRAIQHLGPGRAPEHQLFTHDGKAQSRPGNRSPPSIHFEGEQVSYMELIPRNDQFKGLRLAEVDDLHFHKNKTIPSPGQTHRNKVAEKLVRAAQQQSSDSSTVTPIVRESSRFPSTVSCSRSYLPSQLDSSFSKSSSENQPDSCCSLFGKSLKKTIASATDSSSWSFSELDHLTDTSDRNKPKRKKGSGSLRKQWTSAVPSPVESLKRSDSFVEVMTNRCKSGARAMLSRLAERLGRKEERFRNRSVTESRRHREVPHMLPLESGLFGPAHPYGMKDAWPRKTRSKEHWLDLDYYENFVPPSKSFLSQSPTDSEESTLEVERHEDLQPAANKPQSLASVTRPAQYIPHWLRLNDKRRQRNRCDFQAREGPDRGIFNHGGRGSGCLNKLEYGSSSRSRTSASSVQPYGNGYSSRLSRQDKALPRLYSNKRDRTPFGPTASKQSSPRRSASPRRHRRRRAGSASPAFINADGEESQESYLEDLEHASTSSRNILVHFRNGTSAMRGVSFGTNKYSPVSTRQSLSGTRATGRAQSSSRQLKKRRSTKGLPKRAYTIGSDQIMMDSLRTQRSKPSLPTHLSPMTKAGPKQRRTRALTSRCNVRKTSSPRIPRDTRMADRARRNMPMPAFSVASPPPCRKRRADEARHTKRHAASHSRNRDSPSSSLKLYGKKLLIKKNNSTERSSPKRRTRFSVRSPNRTSRRPGLIKSKMLKNKSFLSLASSSPISNRSAANLSQSYTPSNIIYSMSDIANLLSQGKAEKYLKSRFSISPGQCFSTRTPSRISLANSNRTPSRISPTNSNTPASLKQRKSQKSASPKFARGRVPITSPVSHLGVGLHKRNIPSAKREAKTLAVGKGAGRSTREAARAQTREKRNILEDMRSRYATGYGRSARECSPVSLKPARGMSKVCMGATRDSLAARNTTPLANARHLQSKRARIAQIRPSPLYGNVQSRQRGRRENANLTSNKHDIVLPEYVSPGKQFLQQDFRRQVQFDEHVDGRFALASTRERVPRCAPISLHRDEELPNVSIKNRSLINGRLRPRLPIGSSQDFHYDHAQPSFFSNSPKNDPSNSRNRKGNSGYKNVAPDEANYSTIRTLKQSEHHVKDGPPPFRFGGAELQHQKTAKYRSKRNGLEPLRPRLNQSYCPRNRGSSDGKLARWWTSPSPGLPGMCYGTLSISSKEDKSLSLSSLSDITNMITPSKGMTNLSPQTLKMTKKISTGNSSVSYNTTDDVSASAIFDNSTSVLDYPARGTQPLPKLTTKSSQQHRWHQKHDKSPQKLHTHNRRAHHKTNEHQRNMNSPRITNYGLNYGLHPQTTHGKHAQELQRRLARHRHHHNVN